MVGRYGALNAREKSINFSPFLQNRNCHPLPSFIPFSLASLILFFLLHSPISLSVTLFSIIISPKKRKKHCPHASLSSIPRPHFIFPLYDPKMGNFCACLAPKSIKKKPTKRLLNPPLPTNSSKRWTRVRSSRKEKPDAALTQEQVLAAAILFQQHQQHNARDPFDRTTSLRYPKSGSKNSNTLPRSSSSRARSLTDPLLQPHQLVSEVLVIPFYLYDCRLQCLFKTMVFFFLDF